MTTTADPRARELAQGLRRSVMRLARRLRQMHEESLGLTQNQLSLLGLLTRSGPRTVGQLAELEKVQPPAITRTVKALEQLGLAQRASDPEDGRRAVVEVTGRGREIVLADRRRRDLWLVERLAELTPEERRLLREASELLLRMADS
ncbi:MarR family winged helix-turn-helix transcriptional regulator [Auraticoccus monumenti]|uniref:DNA-binding transcriptional regulator, MarR family n=1 Tax=Auraticoccus monumenti TaxID=675864 RepID=A0A1G6YHJ2_9ACTN|nr:MarR family transcriptional regulator [Auraticoccus monumenti]SDD89187.1 DNA-binding transcriptional regulator, MarR family [Auraticoccus monumenti]